MKRIVLLSIAVAVLLAGAATAQNNHGDGTRVTVRRPVHFDVSPPLRDILPVPAPRKQKLPPEHELPAWINQPPRGAARGRSGPHVDQTWPGTLAMPSPIMSFEGVGTGFPLQDPPGGTYSPSWSPPDTNGDVGLNYYVQWINLAYAVFDKSTGSRVYGAINGNTIWSGFGGRCETDNSGDPIVQYDQLANRWVLTQFAVSASPYYQCVAVSTTSNPLGAYYRYAYSYGSNMNDYPKMGVWPDGYYITYNMFSNGATWAGGEVCAFDRVKMIAGDPAATQQCFGPYSAYGGWLPADLDGSTSPPAGAPNYVLEFGSNNLQLWKFHVDWNTPANSTFTGPTTISVDSFSQACGGGACIPQKGTTNQLDTLADRLMYRLAYRNFGTHESLVVNHSVSGSAASSAIRWYELRDPNGTPTIYQSGTYEPDSTSRWMGSIAMDHMGNIAVGYSASDASTYPSIWYAGRLVSDPPGTLPQAETVLLNGTGSQTTGTTRWGDYSSLSIDPSDDCTFWYTNEYHASNGTTNWHTWIGSFKYPSCSVCSATAPTGFTAAASGNNAIQLSWSAATGATEYRVYRSTTSGGPYTQVGTATAPATSYLDTNLQGGVTYYYVVTNYDGSQSCESSYSSEASATANGPCDLAPTFAGISSATANGCAIDLAWSAATANCGGPVSYSVYRSTTTGFTPALSNRIAAGLSGTTYTDGNGIAVGTTYYYKVRASDESNGQEDSNTVEASAATSSTGTWSEDFESGSTGWSGTGLWHSVTSSSCVTPPAASGTTAWYYGQDSSCDYDTGSQTTGVLTSPTISNVTSTSELSFSYWRVVESYSGAYDITKVEVSYDSGSTWTQVWYLDSSNASSAGWNSSGAIALSPPSSPSSLLVRFTFDSVDALNNTYTGWLIDDIQITNLSGGGCSSTPSDVAYLTARSTSGQVKLEWVNPSGTYGSTRICRDTAGYPSDPTACATLVADVAGTAGAYDTYTDSTVTNANKYYYTAFVNNGSGVYSDGKNAWAYPFATTGKVKWSYSSAASALAPTGVRPGPIGTGGTWAVSNDRMLHGMNPTSAGGDWPRTAPYSWAPMAMNGPAQARPPVVPTTAVSGANQVIFLGSEDGHVYAANAETGTTLWQSPALGSILLASPSGMFTDFGGSFNLLFIGSRDATADNKIYMLNPADGAIITSFDNGGGGNGIGIISSAATVDYANNRIYFASRARAGGSPDTLWCLSFTGTSFTKVWSVALGDIDGAPVLYQGRLYVGNTGGTVYAVNPASGATYWSYAASGDGAVKGFVAPEASVSLPRSLYFSTSTKVWSITDNGSSASLGWSVTSVPGPSIPLVPVGGTVLYVGSSNGDLYQLDAATGAVQTQVQLGDGTATIGSPALDGINNMAYVGSESGAVYGVVLPLQ